MSQENVEIVRRVYDAFNRADEEAVIDLADPEIVIDASRLTFNPNIHVGVQGIRDIAAGMGEVWEEISFEVRDVVDLGERVVVVERLTGKGRGSGIEVAQDWGAVWTVRDGLVVRVELGYPDREAALEAARLAA
jgi:ketosteroid isomerase-like protein